MGREISTKLVGERAAETLRGAAKAFEALTAASDDSEQALALIGLAVGVLELGRHLILQDVSALAEDLSGGVLGKISS